MKRPFNARKALVLLKTLSLVGLLNGCSRSGTDSRTPPPPSNTAYNPGYGPFDQNGNYIEAWADKPARKQNWARQLVVSNTPARARAEQAPPVSTRQRKPATKPPPVVASRKKIEAKPPAASSPQPPKLPTPKPVVKPTPVIRHTVARGDTLYSLGRRYGTSVGAIQRANGLSGTLIRIGQSLRIPK